MTRYLLDTNIISNVAKPRAPAALLTWFQSQNENDLFICTLTVAEIGRGILLLPKGRRRVDLESWFKGPNGPQSLFSGRVLPFDEPAALAWAQIMATRKAKGLSVNAIDMIIAAIAQVHQCVVVTENEGDFRELAFINPVKVSAPQT